MDAWATLAAWRRDLPAEAVFACQTAAWMHGLDSKPTDPVVIIMRWNSTIRSRPSLTVRRSELRANEKTTIKGLPVTTLHRTLRDLSLFGPRIDALIAIDAALCKKLTNKSRLLEDRVTARGRRGSRRLRRLVAISEPAESPMETRLRLLLSDAGPPPEVQTELHDAIGNFIGRADLYYPTARLVVEFDGGNHRERLVSDDRRQNLLMNAGYRVLRFTASDIYQRADIVVSQVRAALDPRRRVA